MNRNYQLSCPKTRPRQQALHSPFIATKISLPMPSSQVAFDLINPINITQLSNFSYQQQRMEETAPPLREHKIDLEKAKDSGQRQSKETFASLNILDSTPERNDRDTAEKQTKGQLFIKKQRKILLIVFMLAVSILLLWNFRQLSQNSLQLQSLLIQETDSRREIVEQPVRVLAEAAQDNKQHQGQENMIEQDSERYMQYSKQNQRKADRIRRQKRIKKDLQDNNILKDIKKNPYLDDEYSFISKEDLERVKKWRFIVAQDPTRPSTLADEERKYFVDKYHIDKYDELPFCLVVPTFNNKPRKRAERNIRSILMQEYKNYHFIIIDDGSVDGTGTLISNYLAAQSIVDPSRYKVEIHTERGYSLPNIRRAAKQFCKPQDIMIVLDGDDELLGRQVLKLFNAVFQEKGVWFMYTNFLGSIGKVGYSRPYHPDIIEKNAYREYSFAVSHLRAYYTQLMLNIKDEDLQDENGNYFTSAGDMAVAIPCMEMAHRRVAYVPEMTYYYNFNTGLNVHRKRINEQRANNLKIRAKKKYEPLDKLF